MNSPFRYFQRSEFDCHETGENRLPDAFIHSMDELRGRCGFPFKITSGYRSPRHHKEAAKDEPGEHTRAAADVEVLNGSRRHTIVSEALKMGFTGIGIAKTFVHVDRRAGTPVIWTY